MLLPFDKNSNLFMTKAMQQLSHVAMQGNRLDLPGQDLHHT